MANSRADTPSGAKRRIPISALFGLLSGALIYLGQVTRRRIARSRVEAARLQAEIQAARDAHHKEQERFQSDLRAAELAQAERERLEALQAFQRAEASRRERLARARAEEAELVREFEIEIVREQDPKRIAYSISRLAHRLCEAPALFFAFQPLTRRCLLTTAAGFPPSHPPDPFMFEMGEEVLKRIHDADEKGEALSLSDYLPLSSQMQLQFEAGRFRAWALTGETRVSWTGQTQTRLLGVLVVLPSASPGPWDIPVGEWIPGLLKSAGRQYEKALPTV